MELLKGETAPAVWLAGVEHLAKCKDALDFDVILNVAEPTKLTTPDAQVYDAVNSFLKSRGAYGVHTVAETLFPLDEYVHGGAKGVFEDYPKRISAIWAARNEKKWGNYAYRILRQKDAAGKIFNPLEDVVAKIKNHGKYIASFELGKGRPFAEEEAVYEDELVIYDPAADRKMLYGGPCLSHLSIKVHSGYIRMNATYRSHYYVRRLLGNLVGLGRLQHFLAHETGLKIGSLTINSTFARLDTGKGSEDGGGRWGKRDVEALMARCREIYAASTPVAA